MNEIKKLLPTFRIGLRTVKSAIAVLLCLVIYRFFTAGNVLFASIAALMCMKETTDQSIKTGVNRFIGTIIGGVLGYILSILTPHIPCYHVLHIIIIPLGIVLCISACVWIKMNEATIICCVVFLIIAFNTFNASQTLEYVVFRVVDTIIGIVIGTLLNRFFFPSARKPTS